MSLRDQLSGLTSWLKGVPGKILGFVKTLRKQKVIVITVDDKSGAVHFAANLPNISFAIATKESFKFSQGVATISFDGESGEFKIAGTL